MNNDFIRDLYNNNYKRVYIFISKLIYSTSPDDIKDCVQEVFLCAMQYEGIESHPNLNGWLFRTSKNIAFHFNREYLRKKKLRIYEDKQLSMSNDLLTSILENENINILLDKDIKSKIIDELNEVEKIFYYLKYCKKMSNKEICSYLNISEGLGTYRDKSLICKVKKIIRKMLDGRE